MSLVRDCEALTLGEIADRLSSTLEAGKSRPHRARLLVGEYLMPANRGDDDVQA